MMSDTAELIIVGKILGPFGVKGEVRVQSLTDVPDRLETLAEVVLESPSGSCLETRVTNVRKDGRSYVLTFAAFGTPEDVRPFMASWIKIPATGVPPLPDGQHYQFELVGLTVVDETGHDLGVLEEVLELPQHHVFVVRGPTGERWIPATKKMVTHVDIPAKRMTVKLIEEDSENHHAV